MHDSLISIIIICILFYAIWYTSEDIFYNIIDYYKIKNIIHRFNKEGKRFYKSMNSFIYFLNKCHEALIKDNIKGYESELQTFYDKTINVKTKFDNSLNEINKYHRYTLIEYIENYQIALNFDNLINKTSVVKDLKSCMNDFKIVTDEFGEMINKICS